MKKKYILSIIICFGICLNSCSDYLDVDRYFNDRQNLDRVFSKKDYTEEWLANAYYQLLNHNLEIGHIRFTITNFSDDAVYNETSGLRNYEDLKFGNYTPDHYSGAWKQSYDGIRQAAIMINHIQPSEEIDERLCNDYKGQAYFIRGYLYWLLLRKYGPIPIAPEKGFDYEAGYDELSLPRNTYDECVEYISEQMLLAASLLERDRDTRGAARPTKGAALATRAKAYLYAASPLMNGNPDMVGFVNDQGKPLISQVRDERKWAKAAAAALDVIELNKYKIYTATERLTGTEIYPATVRPPEHPIYSHNKWPNGWQDIDPFESYSALFNGDLYVAENPELIFTRGDNQLNAEFGIKSLSRHQMPRFGGGYNCHGITGKQCDAYAMNDGTPFDPKTSMKGFTTSDKEYPHLKKDVWKEYANREPRFYASVAFSGSVFPLSSSINSTYRNYQVWYYRGSTEGRVASTRDWQPTGIGMMKYVNPKDSYVNSGIDYPKVDPAIRYADILLMYAEALNELSGETYEIAAWDNKKDYSISRDISKMKVRILPIRLRAGLPNYEDDVYTSQDLLRKAIKRERQIEFLGENQRYFDLRRWLDAQEEEGSMIYGCNTFITQQNAEAFYERVKVPHLQTSFSIKMYFWPVAIAELQRNKRLTQAPGWHAYK